MGVPEESLSRLSALRREMERIFHDFFETPGASRFSEDQLKLNMDVYDNNGEIAIEVELPGVEKQDIDLSVTRDVIIIEGVKKAEESTPARKHQCMERSFGKFRRVIEIPVAGDMNNIAAEFQQGVLYIRLPRIQDRRGARRRVEIR